MRHLSCALFSTDPALGASLRNTLGADLGLEFVFDYTKAPEEIKQDVIAAMVATDPAIVFVDIVANPAVSFRLLQYLADMNANWKLVAIGGEPTPDMALALMRIGVAEYLSKPLVPNLLSAAVERVEKKLSMRPRTEDAEKRGQLIVLAGAKGGSGTSTIAASLATALSEEGRPALAADLDLQLGSLALLLGRSCRYDFVDLVRSAHRIDDGLIQSYIDAPEKGAHLLAAPDSVDKGVSVMEDAVISVLEELRSLYAYVIVDLPSPLSQVSLAAISIADRVLLVSAPDIISLANVKKLLTAFETWSSVPRERVALVLNRCPNGKTPFGREAAQKMLGTSPLICLREAAALCAQAETEGRPVIDVDRSKNGLGSELVALARQLSQPAGEGSQGEAQSKGRFRLFRR